MRTYEMITVAGNHIFVTATSIDHARELVRDKLDVEAADYLRGHNTRLLDEPGVYVKV
jgi:hypothetical protein